MREGQAPPLYLRIVKTAYRPMAYVAHHPLLNVMVGLGLLIIGIEEFIEAAVPEYESVFEVHHAVIIVGFTTLLHGVIGLSERLETVIEVAEKTHHKG